MLRRRRGGVEGGVVGRPVTRQGRGVGLVLLPVLLLSTAGAPGAVAADADDSLPAVSAAVPRGGGCVTPARRSLAGAPWAQAYLGYTRAWERTRGEGVTIAVLDTGVDSDAPALKGRVVVGPDLAGGAGRESGADCAGRGTFVAGLAGAAPLKGTGFAGVAPGARILSVRVTGDDGTASADRVAAGVRAALARKARVIAVPLALPRGSRALTAAVRAAVDQGSVIVAPAYAPAAAGDPETAAPAAYPAALPEVVAVAALAPGGVPDRTLPPLTAPDVAAPGTALVGVGPGRGQLTGSGADLATGFVAGAAALVVTARPQVTGPELADRLTATAYRMPAAGPGLVGAGSVDPVAAVTAPWPARAAAPPGRAVSVAAPAAHTARGTALALTVAVAGAAGALLLGVFTVSRGRRRGWRAGTGAAGAGPDAW
ncbi:S8 family serine peptidase [Streptomyces sp. NPDC056796]|uniref:S8 family serine peptidase n=1 Tax=Streptomyces sp. NPDC056796 TaxID=3345947 RepID=UPI0036ADA754